MPITTTVKLDLDGSGAFATTISQYLLEATVHQGRTKSLDPMEPATATVKLNNADGRFSPDNAAGDYYPDFDDNGVGIRIEAGTRRFTGYIVEIQQDPFIENQEVVLTCTDRLGLLARQTVSCGLFRQQPVHLVLNRVLDCLESGEEITNPGAEGGVTTGYSGAAAGGTISAIDTTSFEGDWCIQAICSGSALQGLRYDLGAAVATNKKIAIFARVTPGDGAVACCLRGLTAAFGLAWETFPNLSEDYWTYLSTTGKTGHRYIELVIGVGGGAATILADCLHQVPDASIIARSIPTTLDAQMELFGLYEAPALENLNRLLATEAAGFLYMRGFDSGYGTIYASAQVVRDAKTTPSATFGDDGTNVPYVGLSYGLDARERISRAEVRSGGAYQTTDELSTVWVLSPTGQLLPASESIVIHANYSQPARGCELVVTPPPSSFTLAATADGGRLQKIGAGTPTVTNQLIVGMDFAGSVYRYRAYLRFNTEPIPDAVLTAAWLRLWVAKNYGKSPNTPFWGKVRDAPSWYPLDATDWTIGDGNPLLGEFYSGTLPPVGQFIDIPVSVTGIDKTGWSEFRLASGRDETSVTPTGPEWVEFYGTTTGKAAMLFVEYVGGTFATAAMDNYGVGAEITLEAGSLDAIIPDINITGYPLKGASEESVVIADAITPPIIPATLSVEMPFQGTRTPDMVAEAARLALRHSGKVRRLPLSLQEQDAASLTQMQTRELDDLVTVINEAFAFSTKINDQFFIEGMDWTVSGQGKVLEVVYNLEEK